MRPLVWVLLSFVLASTASGQAINSNVALPVSKGEGIFRSQLRYVRATDDPSRKGRELEALVVPQTLVVGWTPRFATFSTLPVLAHQRLESGTGASRRDEAVGDLRLLGRYTFFADDYAPLSTRRAAALFGMKFPTGADRFGTPSFDPIGGLVGTWAANRHELDMDAVFSATTKRHGFEAGDALRYDVAYRYRLWPRRFEGRLLQLNAVLELNGSWVGRARSEGASVRSSGGSVLLLSPGLQFITQRLIVEASLQLPIHQDLNGDQLESDFVAVLSVRVPFELF